MEKKIIHFSIGTNFDPLLLEEIKKADQKEEIKSVFGKLPIDIFGGGRAAYVSPQLNLGQLKTYIDYCNKNHMEFNYLLNPMCLDNREIRPRSNKKIIKFLDLLSNTGISSVTVNSLFLCKLIKELFPHLKITIGLYAGVYALQQVKYWENLGANTITLGHHVNRNFHILEQILGYTKNTGTEIRLIANNSCLHFCPYFSNHGTMQSHASQKKHPSNKYTIDYCLITCLFQRIQNPASLLASHWIRPEDIHYYEDLCKKTDNFNLSFKLLERTCSTDFLLRVLKAYTSRSFDGNLLSILNWPSKDNTDIHFSFSRFLKIIMSGYNIRKLAQMGEIFKLPHIYIDNKQLNGFLSKFITNNECITKLCTEEKVINNKALENRNSCAYCNNWAEKVITYNQEEITTWLKITKEFLKNISKNLLF